MNEEKKMLIKGKKIVNSNVNKKNLLFWWVQTYKMKFNNSHNTTKSTQYTYIHTIYENKTALKKKLFDFLKGRNAYIKNGVIVQWKGKSKLNALFFFIFVHFYGKYLQIFNLLLYYNSDYMKNCQT